VKAKEIRRGGLVTRSLSRYCLLVRLGMESEKFKERRKEDRAAYRYESVVLGMSKSLVGVGNPQLRTKDFNVNFYFFWCVKL
jgi:hypothetical protein